MEYITNEAGDVKLIDAKGNVKWLSPFLVKESRLMARMGFTPVEKVKTFEAAPLNNAKDNSSVPKSDGAKTDGKIK